MAPQYPDGRCVALIDDLGAEWFERVLRRCRLTYLLTLLLTLLGAEWFERVIRSVEDTRNTQLEQLKLIWHAHAVALDSVSRWLLPLAYYTCCVVLYCNRLPNPAPTALVATDGT